MPPAGKQPRRIVPTLIGPGKGGRPTTEEKKFDQFADADTNDVVVPKGNKAIKRQRQKEAKRNKMPPLASAVGTKTITKKRPDPYGV
jgi:hypothetical protein